MSKDLVSSSSGLDKGAPSFPYKGDAAGTYNGEPGLPERTHSPNAVPEKTRDEAAPLPSKRGGNS